MCSASEINGTEEFNLIDYFESHDIHRKAEFQSIRLFKNGAIRAPRTTPVSAPQTCTCYSDTLQGTGATFGNVTFS